MGVIIFCQQAPAQQKQAEKATQNILNEYRVIFLELHANYCFP